MTTTHAATRTYVSLTLNLPRIMINNDCVVRCDLPLGIEGFCCRKQLKNLQYITKSPPSAIGSTCRVLRNEGTVRCINTLGTTTLAYPSATTVPVPSATQIPANSSDIIYSPANAWKMSNTNSNCTTSKSLHVTDTLNATILFNYTGEIHNYIEIHRGFIHY